MIFTPTSLDGAWLVDMERREDDRGYFARTWCHQEFLEQGLVANMMQCSLSHTRRRGTLRGMHWQAAPHEEAKLVRCSQGAIWDVIIDLRPESLTYTRHYGVELAAGTHRALYVPQGFAHGFVAMANHTEVFYQMSEFHAPESARGVCWNDPAFGIEWPIADPIVSERDETWADFLPERRS